MELQRITTRYSAAEDRLCLSGLDGCGETHVLWLTHRLMRQLIPRLCEWVHLAMPQQWGAQVANSDLAGIHNFAQQAALAALQPAEPVSPLPGAQSAVCVAEVDIALGAGVRLVFRGPAADSGPGVSFDAQALRQWLSIVRQQWELAQWAADVFPAWLQTSPAVPPFDARLH